MNSLIHPSAVIDPSAVIGENVEIAPNVVIGKDVKLGAGVKIYPNAYLEYCEIGEGTQINVGAVIGTPPQDMNYKGQPSKVIIGKNCQIREHVTVNRASKEGEATIVGDGCMLMIGSHVAHDCKLGNNVILANLVSAAGFVEIGDFSFIGGSVVLHQFVKIGEMVIMGGFSGTRQDIPPYAKTEGRPAAIIGTNVVGLRRRGLSSEERAAVKKAYNLIWYSGLNTKTAIEKIKEEVNMNPYVERLIDFIQTSKRGVVKLVGKQELEEDK
ncbi:MAG: acyl-ACP--UDP-N-acetylglucosamine O-acyltransferase [bacterium]